MANQDDLRKELRKLKQGHDTLAPESIIQWAASHPHSALHSVFTWNDTEAAHKHRLWEARQLLIKVKISYSDPEPVYVSLSVDRTAGGGYRSMAEVKKQPNLRAVLLKDAITSILGAASRYRSLSELESVFDAIDKAAREFLESGKAA